MPEWMVMPRDPDAKGLKFQAGVYAPQSGYHLVIAECYKTEGAEQIVREHNAHISMKTIGDYEVNEIQLYGGGPFDQADVTLVRRRQREGNDLWAIMDRGCALDRDGEWELEPMPSGRDADYLDRTRYKTPAEAITHWQMQTHPTRFWRYGQNGLYKEPTDK